MFEKNEIIKLNAMEFQLFYNIIMNNLRKQVQPKKGFRPGASQDPFIISKHGDRIRHQIVYFAVKYRYGQAFDDQNIDFEVVKDSYENGEYNFEIKFLSKNEELLKNLKLSNEADVDINNDEKTNEDHKVETEQTTSQDIKSDKTIKNTEVKKEEKIKKTKAPKEATIKEDKEIKVSKSAKITKNSKNDK